jgi:iron complex outermembrane receptor protein/vitamin B12 transporter
MSHVRPRLSHFVLSLALFGLGISASPAWAQQPTRGTIAGAVIDPLGARVAGATVVLAREAGPTAQTTTDAQGQFVFDAVESGRYQLSVTAPGFEPQTTPSFFAGAGRTTEDVSLRIGALEQDVVVTAEATPVPASQIGAPVTVIDRETIEALAKPDVLEALRLVPGTNVVQTGARGGVTSLFVRGGDSSFNKVLMDGVPANDIGGAFSFAEVTTTGVDRVEVLRDANSVLYGSDALAGVISLTTRRGRTRTPEVALSFDGGSFNTFRGDGSIGGVFQQVDYFADLSHFNTDNDLPNNAYRNTTVASRFGWAVAHGTNLSATVRHMSSRYGSPGGTSLFGIPDDSFSTSDATYVGVAAESQIDDRWQTTVRFVSADLGYHADNPTPTGQPFDPFGLGPSYLGNVVTLRGANGFSVTGQGILDFIGDYPQLYDSTTTRRAGYGQASVRLSNALDLAAGAHIEHESGSTTFSGPPSSTERTNGGLFVEGRARVRRVFASAGLGYEHNAIFKSAVTPRVSIAVYLRDPSSTAAWADTKLIFNAGTGIKAPTIAQELSSLYAVLQSVPAGSLPPAAAAVSPIGPERSRSVDAGVEQGLWGGRARVRASYFDNSFSDLIEYVSKTALPSLGIPPAVAAATGFGAYVNSSSYWARGLETSADAVVGPMVRVRASYTYLHAVVTRSLASGALTPAINPAFPDVPIGAFGPLVGAAPFRRPSNVGTLMTTFTRGPAQASVAGYFVGKSDDSTFLYDGFFGNTMLLPNHDLLAGYQKIDLSASYRFHPRVRWYVSIENLLNQSYEAAYGFPALPFGVRTGATVTLGGGR